MQQIFIDRHTVLGQFKNIKAYEEFIYDQIAYAKELEKIKHLVLEDV